LIHLFAEPGYGEEGYDVEDVGGDGEEVGVELFVLEKLGFGERRGAYGAEADASEDLG
jgi:hypothetical protein